MRFIVMLVILQVSFAFGIEPPIPHSSLCLGNEHPRCFYFHENQVFEGSAPRSLSKKKIEKTIETLKTLLRAAPQTKTAEMCLIPIVLTTANPKRSRTVTCEESLTESQRQRLRLTLKDLE